MLTQQDILEILNRMTLQYNLTWRDIKYDADKAINKINSYLGTVYPKMSEVLLSPESTYTFRSDSIDVEYFPEEHIHSVVIPFIAMEVLARDEEFTTVYNKYDADLQDGLFIMFQKEFNRVPLAFRQNPDQGVFFGADSAAAEIKHNELTDLPVYRFRVHYHINNDNIVLGAGLDFIEDMTAYEYEDTYTVLDWNVDLLSHDGTKSYSFVRWLKSPTQVTEEGIVPGSEHTILTDVHLYAVWEEIETLDITIDGIVSIKDEFKLSLTSLVIPDLVNGVIVRTVGPNFIKHSTDNLLDAINLNSITLPNYLTKIDANAFDGFAGSSIIIPETVISPTYSGISIYGNAFANTDNLTSIILPTNIHTISASAFPEVSDKSMVIYVRSLLQNKPDGWAADWYAAANPSNNYFIDVVWGHNV